MNVDKKVARLAGLVYLVVVVTGIFSLAYVPSRLIVWGDALLTFNNIVNSESLFRFGILSALVCYVFFLFLPLVLYRVLKSVNEAYAKIMVILAVVSVPISFINIQNKLAILSLISNEKYLDVFTNEQLQSQVMFYLNQYDNGILIVQIFWGLWLLPFGYLVYKSQFLPKTLGIFLMVGCFGYLINTFGHLVVPGYSDLSIASFVSLPASIGEIGVCLWLLIMGVNLNRVK